MLRERIAGAMCVIWVISAPVQALTFVDQPVLPDMTYAPRLDARVKAPVISTPVLTVNGRIPGIRPMPFELSPLAGAGPIFKTVNLPGVYQVQQSVTGRVIRRTPTN